MKPISAIFQILALSLVLSCSSENIDPVVMAPSTYTFERDGVSTVSFAGQTTRIKMAEELISSMQDFSVTEELLLEMFRNENESGAQTNPFDDSELNASTKSIRSKTAASKDFFSANTTESSQIRSDFEGWIKGQVSEVFVNKNELAAPGKAGQIADGSATRYVNALGFEYNQMVNKSLIGALMVDQALNNYLGTAVLDEATNIEDNDNIVPAEGNIYTNMEHKWDEAYGYFYGTTQNPTAPNLTIGEDDNFLNKYIGRVESDPDFTGIADEIYNAFKLGRAAIVAGKYMTRDEQANTIKELTSKIIAIRAVYYLQQAKIGIPADRSNYGAYGAAFHDLSEGLGFIYSLRFTRKPGLNEPYFTKSDVDGYLDALLEDGSNGLWDIELQTLDEISAEIADKFDFTVDQAGS